MADTYAQVVTLAQQALGDREGTVWDTNSLLPFVNSAHLELQERLLTRGATLNVKVTAPLSLAVGQTVLSGSSSPPLPGDFVLPYRCEERTTGGSDKFNPMDLIEKTPLPDVDQDSSLKIWGWFNGVINFIGSTGPVDVRLTYEARMPDLAAGTDVLPIINSKNYLAYRAATIIAPSRGNAGQAMAVQALCEQAWDNIVRAHVRAKQFAARRRIPFGYKRVTFG